MKLPVLRRLDMQDIQGKDKVPDWVSTLLQALNTFLDPVGKCLQRRITFTDQFYGVQTVTQLTHAKESVINPIVQSGYSINQIRIVGVTVIDTGGQIVTGFGWNRKTNGTIGVTANFLAAGNTQSTCVLQIQFG